MPKATFFNLPEDKRERIAELAIEEFGAHPYSAASISRIVARAGIAKGSFYQYFHNKLDMYRWLLFEVSLQKKVVFMRAMPPPVSGDFFAELEHLYFAGMRFGLAHPHLSRLAAGIWRTTPSDPDLVAVHRELQALAWESMRAVVQQAIDAGQLRGDINADSATDFLLAASQQGLDLAMHRRLGVDLIEFCARPELAERFPETEQRALIRELVGMVRSGLGSGASSAAAEKPVIDFDGVPVVQRFGGSNEK